MNVIASLRDARGLTGAEAAIAGFLLSHLDDVGELTVGDVARLSHTSASAVVRLCHKLGLDGYRALRVEVARSVERERMSASGVNPDRPFIEGRGTADVVASIAALSRQAIDASYASLDVASVREAARLVLGARRVAYYGVGDSLVSLEMFATLLLKIGVPCTDGMLRGDLGAVGHLLDARDLFIVVSHSGALLEAQGAIFADLRSRGVRSVIITANRGLGAAYLGTDCHILLPQGESRAQRLATFYSQECVRFVLNCIYAEAYGRNYQANVARWDRIMGLEAADGE